MPRSGYALSDRELAVLDQADTADVDDDPSVDEPDTPAGPDTGNAVYLVRAIDSALMAIDREDLDIDAPSLDQLLAIRERVGRR